VNLGKEGRKLGVQFIGEERESERVAGEREGITAGLHSYH
jgi:hypothetical protein